MSGFADLDPFELALLATLIGVAIADVRGIEEQNTIGNFIIAIGATILSIASQKQFLILAEVKAEEEKNKKEIEEIKQQLQELLLALDSKKTATGS